jgi:hypothetical protein
MRPFALFRGWLAVCIFAGLISFGGCNSSANSAPQPAIASSAAPAVAAVLVQDLDGHAVDPMPKKNAAAVVFIFTRCDCPISNRYVPEYCRLAEKYASRGVVFRLIYPEPDETADDIRKHQTEFQLPCEAFRDPQHALVHRCGIDTTPEAAVFLDDRQTMVYRGRIDDRFVAFGVSRPEATIHDLEQAIEGALAGRSSKLVTTRAIGCPVVDSP